MGQWFSRLPRVVKKLISPQYIHGSGATSKYMALDSSYKNPAQTNEKHGLKMTIDTTATWNSQMERAELIPQTTANLGTGTLFYHFSIKRSNTNAPDVRELIGLFLRGS